MFNSFTALKSYLLLLTASLLLSACGGDTDTDTSSKPAPVERGALLSSDVISEYPVRNYLRLVNFSAESGRAYDVEVVRLTYNTSLESGDIVQASGIVALPLNKEGVSPLLSYQHATLFLDSVVPGNDPIKDMTPIFSASAGFVAVAPDYIGYGASKALSHPYIQAVPSANSVIDLIRAARVYLKQRNIALNDQLFLAGYSEGGYVSMAAHQQMETQYADEFTVTANVVGGGPYDVRGTVETILLDDARLNSPAYFGFLVHAYDRYYELDNLTLRAIKSPHHLTVDEYYDGDRSGSAINSVLPRDTDELFNGYFLSDFASLTGELTLKYRLEENNVYDWTPRATLRMYHGQKDETVPYRNATTALAAMTQSKETDVSLTDCDMVPSTHVNCAVGFATFAIDYLLGAASDR